MIMSNALAWWFDLFLYHNVLASVHECAWIYYMMCPCWCSLLISHMMMQQSSLHNFRIVLQVKAEDMDAYDPKNLLVVTTGSQVRLTD